MSVAFRHIAWVLSLALLCGPSVLADHDPAARAKAVAPFLDGRMILLAHVDLAKVDIEPLVNKVAEWLPEAGDETRSARTGMRRVKDTLLQAGAHEVYVVVSLADLPKDAPVVVIPHAAMLKRETLTALPRNPDQVIETWRGSLVIASRRALERLKKSQAVERPELLEALRAAGDTAMQVVVAPGDDDRRVVEELEPTLPANLGGGPSTIITQGLVWLAIGIDPPPRTAVKLTIQSRDAEAAAALRKKLTELASDPARWVGTDNHAELASALRSLVPSAQGDRLTLQLDQPDASIRALVTAVRSALEPVRKQAQRQQSSSNLKQLALAMHNFHDFHKRYPATGTFDAAGRPLLSWRVHILPFLGQKALYDQFHLQEPWDSEHNRQLIPRMPAVFRSPVSRSKPSEGLATYREICGEHTLFPGKDGVNFGQVVDGTSNTILFVKVDDEHAVVWTKPDGLPFQTTDPAHGWSRQFGGYQVAFCDGSVRFLTPSLDVETLRRLLMIDDRQPVPDL